MIDRSDPSERPAELVEAETFAITTEEAATWYMRKLLDHDADIVAINARAKFLIDRITQLRDEQIATVQADKRGLIRLYESAFMQYIRGCFAQKKWGKTINLLVGKAVLRTVPRSVSVGNESAAFLHAKQHFPQCIKETLRKDEYLKAFKETGEELPGLKIKEAYEKLSYDGQEEDPTEPPELPPHRTGLLAGATEEQP